MTAMLFGYLYLSCLRGLVLFLTLAAVELSLRRRLLFPGLRIFYLALIAMVVLPAGLLTNGGAPGCAGTANWSQWPAEPEAARPTQAADSPATAAETTTGTAAEPLISLSDNTDTVPINWNMAFFATYLGIVAILWARRFATYLIWRRGILRCEAITGGRVREIFRQEIRNRGMSADRISLRNGSTLLSSPATFGTRRGGAVLCPLLKMNFLTDSEIRMLMIHELEHLRRSDNSTSFFLALLQDLFFPNVFLRLFASRLAMVSEMDCDAAANNGSARHNSEPAVYARLLLAFQQQRGGRCANVPSAPLGATAKKLRLRIREVCMNKPSKHRMLAVITLAVAAGTAALTPSAFASSGDADINAMLARYKIELPEHLVNGIDQKGDDVPELSELTRFKFELDAKENVVLRGNERAGELLEKLCLRESLMFNRDWSRGLNTLLPELGKLRTAARYNQSKIAEAVRRNEPEIAAGYVVQNYRLAGFLADDPLIISQLVAIGIETMTLESMEGLLPALSPADLEKIQKAITGLEKNYWKAADRAIATDVIMIIHSKPDISQSENDLLLAKLNDPASAEEYRTALIDATEFFLKIHQLPANRRKAAIDDFVSRMEQSSNDAEKIAGQYFSGINLESALINGYIRLKIAQCAVEYNLAKRTGTAPKVMPVDDPMTGKSFQVVDGSIVSAGYNDVPDDNRKLSFKL
ncbi:MAG: M56 family metallopeptidase [Victivallaceae bacterium]|nr:M56 family metallopeptidase [Victivallaceae bacterium]